LRQQKKDLSLRKLRLENIVQAHPLAAEWWDIQAQLAPISNYPQNLDFGDDHLIGLLTRRIELVAKWDQALQNADQLTEKLADVQPDPKAIGLVEKLDALAERKSQVVAGQIDLPKREAELAQETADLRARLAATGLSSSGDLSRFILIDPDLAALQRARTVLDDAHKHLAIAQSEASDAQDKQRETTRLADEAAIDLLGDPALDQIVIKAEAEDTFGRYTEAQYTLTAARQNYSTRLRELTRQTVTFDQVPPLSISFGQARKQSADLSEAGLALNAAKQTVAAALVKWTVAQM
jgi:hypothetical protein